MGNAIVLSYKIETRSDRLQLLAKGIAFLIQSVFVCQQQSLSSFTHTLKDREKLRFFSPAATVPTMWWESNEYMVLPYTRSDH